MCLSLPQTWNRRESLLQVTCFREVEKGLSSSPATVQKPSFAFQLLYLYGLIVWSCGGYCLWLPTSGGYCSSSFDIGRVKTSHVYCFGIYLLKCLVFCIKRSCGTERFSLFVKGLKHSVITWKLENKVYYGWSPVWFPDFHSGRQDKHIKMYLILFNGGTIKEGKKDEIQWKLFFSPEVFFVFTVLCLDLSAGTFTLLYKLMI